MTDSDHGERLAELRRRVDAFPAIDEPPATTLDVLGEATTEGHWESLLVYFLRPENPHGFGTDVATAFLDAIVDHDATDTTLPYYDLDELSVESQVGTGQGIPDILLWVEDEWFLCVELKVAASETERQTVRYAKAKQIGDVTVSEYDHDRRLYVYLAPADSATSDSEEFADLSWEYTVGYLGEILVDDRGRYPSRSRAQYADFLDTIKDELKMTEYEEHQREKALLRIKYSDTIEEVNEALSEIVEQAQKDWENDFQAEVTGHDQQWNTHLLGNKYAHAFRPEWVYTPDNSEPVEQSSDGDIAVAYECEIDEDCFTRETLELTFKSAKRGHEEALRQHVDEYMIPRIDQIADEYEIEMLPQNKAGHFIHRVPFELEAGHTLGGQFARGVADVAELNDRLSGLFSDAIQEWSGSQ